MQMEMLSGSYSSIVEACNAAGMEGRPARIIGDADGRAVIQVGWDDWYYDGEDEKWRASWYGCSYIEVCICS